MGALMKAVEGLVSELHVKDVLLTGGEPLSVLNEAAPVLSYLKRSGVSFSVSTNLPDKSALDLLATHGPRAINMSIDPPLDTKSGSAFKADYAAIEEKLLMADEAGIDVKLTAVMTRGNIGNIGGLLDKLSLLKHSSLVKVAFNREYPIGHAAESEPLSSEELRETLRLIQSWTDTMHIPVSLVNWDEFHAPLQACPAGSSLVALMPNGDVAPCSLLYNLTRSFRLGNILKDPMEQIVHGLTTFAKEVQKYAKQTQDNTPACHKCRQSDSCGGGCPAMLPIAANHVSRRTCLHSPTRVPDHERALLADFHHSLHMGYSPERKAFAAPQDELPPDAERKLRDHIRNQLRPSDLAHTLDHIDCVVGLARFISKKEGASLKITVPAAYFHDVWPREPAIHNMHTFKSALYARDHLRRIGGFTDEEILHIQYCIYTSSYGTYLLGYQPLSLEARVVRDADWLDAIGARGIARAFAFAQAHGCNSMGYPEFDPEGFLVSMDMNITGPDPSPIMHFFTKLLKIYPLLQTDAGREMGQRRHALMVAFLNEYRTEMDVGNGRTRQMQLRYLTGEGANGCNGTASDTATPGDQVCHASDGDRQQSFL
jgi:uncharacterized protein